MKLFKLFNESDWEKRKKERNPFQNPLSQANIVYNDIRQGTINSNTVKNYAFLLSQNMVQPSEAMHNYLENNPLEYRWILDLIERYSGCDWNLYACEEDLNSPEGHRLLEIVPFGEISGRTYEEMSVTPNLLNNGNFEIIGPGSAKSLVLNWIRYLLHRSDIIPLGLLEYFAYRLWYMWFDNLEGAHPQEILKLSELCVKSIQNDDLRDDFIKQLQASEEFGLGFSEIEWHEAYHNEELQRQLHDWADYFLAPSRIKLVALCWEMCIEIVNPSPFGNEYLSTKEFRHLIYSILKA